MKLQIFRPVFVLSSVFVIMLWSCEEEGPDIPLKPDPADTALEDTTYITSANVSPQKKNVLIEDFTGVRCPNCPFAARVYEGIMKDHPGRIAVLGIHVTDQFGTPYTDSKEDYRIPEGKRIYEMLGKGGLPTGDVDRFLFPGENEVLVNYNNWPGYAGDRLKEGSPMRIDLEAAADSTGKNVLVRVEATYTEAGPTGKHYLTVALTENDIIDLQDKSPDGLVRDYEHDHVLRDVLTSAGGVLLKEDPEKKRVFIKEFRGALDDHWKVENMGAVAFIHKNFNEFTVFQVQQISLKN